MDDGTAGATAPSVSLVLPAWNEAEGLDHWLEDAVVALESLVASGLVGRFEVVVVDDGSTDATAEVVTRAADRRPGIRLVSHDRNRGVGAGLRTGLQAATGDFVVSTDADMPVDLAEIGPALRLIQAGEAELVAGSRIERSEDGLVRWLCTAGYDIVVSIAFGVRVDDVNFAFKVARTDLLRSLDLRSEGAFIDAELMASAVLAGHDVHVTRMSYRPREYGRSSTLTLRTLGGLGREFVQHAPRIRRLRRQRRQRRRSEAAQSNG